MQPGGASVATYGWWAVEGKTSREELWITHGTPKPDVLATTGGSIAIHSFRDLSHSMNRYFPFEANRGRFVRAAY
jgi:hypothetical protein